MNSQRKKRVALVCFILLGMGVSAALILTAFQKNLLYFYSPTQVSNGEAPNSRPFRVGGLVEIDSVQRDPNSLFVSFKLTDNRETITVKYEGILPDLFREGQGIVANGKLDSTGIFQASEVLAKHDENYMPPEVAEALANAGTDISMPHNYTNK
ncbi:MAG: cytochrome c maturation protein CcmE [Pseudomonadota bacterium]